MSWAGSLSVSIWRTSVLNTYSAKARRELPYIVSATRVRTRQRQHALVREEQVEVLQRLALQHHQQSVSPVAAHRARPRTIRKVSILSSSATGSASTFSTLAYPPDATRQCASIASKISQPHCRYCGSPVRRHAIKSDSTVSGLHHTPREPAACSRSEDTRGSAGTHRRM